MRASSVLLVMNDIPSSLEDDFYKWHRDEQAPAMLAVPGVLGAQLYRAVDGEPAYLAVYELQDGKALEMAEYQRSSGLSAGTAGPGREVLAARTNLTQAVYEHILTLPEDEPADLSGATALALLGLEVAPETEAEFQDWYNTEHLPALSGTPGVLRARRFRLGGERLGVAGRPTAYVALYDLERPETVSSEEWKRRANTPWTQRMRRLWTTRKRIVYERVLSA